MAVLISRMYCISVEVNGLWGMRRSRKSYVPLGHCTPMISLHWQYDNGNRIIRSMQEGGKRIPSTRPKCHRKPAAKSWNLTKQLNGQKISHNFSAYLAVCVNFRCQLSGSIQTQNHLTCTTVFWILGFGFVFKTSQLEKPNVLFLNKEKEPYVYFEINSVP